MRKSLSLALLVVPGIHAFQLNEIFKSFNKAAPSKTPQFGSTSNAKAELLEAISFTNNGKDATPEKQLEVLEKVRSIEIKSPPSPNLLSDPKEAEILDGPWYLHYTSPSDPSLIDAGESDQFPDAWKAQGAEDKITTQQSGYKGSVNAAGIKVDTSNRTPLQTIDVGNMLVTNTIDLDFGRVVVGGPFRPSDNISNRVVVSFKQCDITLNSGFNLNLGFLFSILSLFRGTEESGWLETTYVDSTMRIGRGNKGTMFVLTRSESDVKA